MKSIECGGVNALLLYIDGYKATRRIQRWVLWLFSPSYRETTRRLIAAARRLEQSDRDLAEELERYRKDHGEPPWWI